ncbi:DinB-like protein, PF04978 family [Lentzea aerocolonigenes]|uniref:DinB-like protein, PF04978 family n=1 Tax=Lentzea aerocolonigenes TaxID=68170 RepID=A0A0F0GF15_LENAE|nr:DinB family protein [Lentzea aerocolonigenes]KJK34083.1 DinB-like protein, PF04978 family [Lentzea aerocolonigenes]
MASDPKADLHRYLRTAREVLLWKLEGLSEYDARRPLTPTGTNLLGLIKHVATTEQEYFGACLGRKFPETLPWMEAIESGSDPNADMFATADESREDILSLYARVGEFADSVISELPLDAPGVVPWWPEERRYVTLHLLLVHMIAETNRHAGHADILREGLDGLAGLRDGVSNMPEQDWAAYREKLERVAQESSDQA